MMDPILQAWFTPAAIDRRTLWRWLEPDATELAEQYWWGPLPLSDIQTLMKARTFILVQRKYAFGLDENVKANPQRDEIALGVLEQAIDRVKLAHDDTYDTLFAATLAALRRGADRPAAAAAVRAIAGERTPKFPPRLIEDALEDAATEYREATKFWRARALDKLLPELADA